MFPTILYPWGVVLSNFLDVFVYFVNVHTWRSEDSFQEAGLSVHCKLQGLT